MSDLYITKLWRTVLALCLVSALGEAAPFDKQFVFTQPEGTTITLKGWGDEFFAVFETLDGYAVVYEPACKTYFYADLSADGNALESTGLQVGQGDPRSLNLKKHLRISPAARKAKALERQKRWDAALKVSSRWKQRKDKHRQADLFAAPGTNKTSISGGIQPAPPAWTTTGTKVGLTLLVDFSDSTGTVAQAEILNFCNGTGYTGSGNNGSVKEYFYDNSDGLLTYTNVVTAYVRMPQPKSFYDDGVTQIETQGPLFVRYAIGALTNLPNYASTILPLLGGLTTDADSCVVACNIFYAGSCSSGWGYGLWPHSYSVAWPGIDLGNGKKIYAYQITDIGSSLELGTFCHENGHMLCDYPDLYDYGGDSVGGAGMFCLMNSGGHGGNPVQICAYLKTASGWASLVDLTASSSLTATVSAVGADFNKFYRYTNPGASTEYYLIENRQAFGRDALLPASGIAVWHIDELGDRDNQSLVTNSLHANYEVTLVQADNLWHFEADSNSGDANDLYYAGNAAAAYSGILSEYSTPSAHWWNGAASGLYLRNFSSSATNMTFIVGNPYPLPVTNGMTLVAECALPLNGVIDPGETVSVELSVRNIGGRPTTNLTATLLPLGGVTAPSGSMSYGALANGESASRPFMFTATGTCGSVSFAALQLQDGALNYGNYTNTFVLGGLDAVYTQYFDTVTVPALPSGWTSSEMGAGSLWGTTNSASDTTPNSVFSPSSSATGTSILVSPVVSISSPLAQLTFRHNYDLETYAGEGCDGGVLELRVGAGVWQDVSDAGGVFVEGGYNYTVSTDYGSALAGRLAWSGFSGGFTPCVVALPASVAGTNVQFRWLQACDESVAHTGWHVDTIRIVEPACSGEPSEFQTWRFRSFGNVTSVNTTANADWDNDGSSNTNEFLCGTIATNPASLLTLEGCMFAGTNGCGISWQCVPGKTYQVAYVSALSGSWVTNLPGSLVTAGGGVTSMSYTDTTAAVSTTNRFYRILLVP